MGDQKSTQENNVSAVQIFTRDKQVIEPSVRGQRFDIDSYNAFDPTSAQKLVIESRSQLSWGKRMKETCVNVTRLRRVNAMTTEKNSIIPIYSLLSTRSIHSAVYLSSLYTFFFRLYYYCLTRAT